MVTPISNKSSAHKHAKKTAVALSFAILPALLITPQAAQAATGVSPTGWVDSVKTTSTGVNLRGWAFDADTTASIQVQVQSNGKVVKTLTANKYRPDVKRVHTKQSSNHGFESAVTLPGGTNKVCVYGVNVKGGQNKLLKCETVKVPSSTVSIPAPKPVSVKPGATNTGVTVGTKLTRYDGTLTITKDNQVVEGLDVHGVIRVKAKNVTIRNTIVRGFSDPKVKTYSMIQVNASGANTAYSANIHNVEIFAQAGNPYDNGIMGYNFTAKKVNIHNVIDAVHIYGDNVRVESSWLHNNLYFANDPQHSDGSHSDSVQIQKGKNLVFYKNTVTGSKTSGFMITQDRGSVSNFNIDSNWIDNGGCSINISGGKAKPTLNSKIVNNRFGNHQTVASCHIIKAPENPVTISGNVIDSSGVPATVKRGQS